MSKAVSYRQIKDPQNNIQIDTPVLQNDDRLKHLDDLDSVLDQTPSTKNLNLNFVNVGKNYPKKKGKT